MEKRGDQDDFEELDGIYNDHFGHQQPRVTEARSEEQPRADEGEEEPIRVNTDEVLDRNIQEYAASIAGEDGESDEDEDGEIAEIRRSLVTGCKCKTGCYHQFSQAQIFDHILVLNIREMEKGEKDLYIMGTLVSNSTDSLNTRRGPRKQSHFSYRFDGKGICREVYKIVFDIGEKHLRNILKHMKTNGTVPRTHGNKGKKPHNALTFQDIKKVVQFIINFSEENGIPLPAAPHGRDDIPPVLYVLPFQRKTFIRCI